MKKKGNLINIKYGKDFSSHLLKQYKLYVETAERVSDRRQSANNFYLSLNSAISALSGYLSATVKDFWIIFVSITGILISLAWIQNINSYKQLNTAKYQVIHEMENHLPASLFKTEWIDWLEEGKGEKYKKLTTVEKNVPKIFIMIYLILILFSIIFFLFNTGLFSLLIQGGR